MKHFAFAMLVSLQTFHVLAARLDALRGFGEVSSGCSAGETYDAI
jgi:hypothetical protein